MVLHTRSDREVPVTQVWWRAGASLLRAILWGVVPLIGLAPGVSQIDLPDLPQHESTNVSLVSSGRTTGLGVREIHLSPDSKTAWVTRFPAIVQQVDLTTGEVLSQTSVSSTYANHVQWSSIQHQAVILEDDRGIRWQSVGAPSEYRIIRDTQHEVVPFAVNPTRNGLVMARETKLEFYRIDDLSPIQTVAVDAAIRNLKWSNDGSLLLVLLANGSLQLYDEATRTLARTQQTPHITGHRILWGDHGTHVAVCSEEGTIVVWNVQQNEVKTINLTNSIARAVALSPDGEWVAYPDLDDQIWLISTANAGEPRFLGCSPSLLNALCFTADGQSLLVGGMEGRLERWSIANGTVEWSLQANLQVADAMPLPLVLPTRDLSKVTSPEPQSSAVPYADFSSTPML